MKKNTIISLVLSAILGAGSLVSSAAMAQSENAAPVAEEVSQGDHAQKKHKKAKKAKHKAKKAKHKAKKAKHKAKKSH